MEFTNQEIKEIWKQLEKYPTKYGKWCDLLGLALHLIENENFKIEGVFLDEFPDAPNTFIPEDLFSDVTKKVIHGNNICISKREFPDYFGELGHNIYEAIDVGYFDDLKNMIPFITDPCLAGCFKVKLVDKATLMFLSYTRHRVLFNSYEFEKKEDALTASSSCLSGLASNLEEKFLKGKPITYPGTVKYEKGVLEIDANVFEGHALQYPTAEMKIEELENKEKKIDNARAKEQIYKRIYEIQETGIKEIYHPAIIKI